MAELLQEGFTLTLLGMSVVFVLLTVLVGAIHLMSRFCRLFDGTEAAEAAPVGSPAAAPEPDELAAVAAAIRMFRRNRARSTG